MAVDTDPSFAIWIRGGGLHRCCALVAGEKRKGGRPLPVVVFDGSLCYSKRRFFEDVLLRVLRLVAKSCSFWTSLEEALSPWALPRLISERLGLVVTGVRGCVEVPPTGVVLAVGRGGDDSGVNASGELDRDPGSSGMSYMWVRVCSMCLWAAALYLSLMRGRETRMSRVCTNRCHVGMSASRSCR